MVAFLNVMRLINLASTLLLWHFEGASRPDTFAQSVGSFRWVLKTLSNKFLTGKFLVL